MTAADELLLLDTPATRPCTHPRAKHKHGTVARYNADRCRCTPCRDAHRDYETTRNKQIAYGRWQAYADASDARAHVEALIRAGLSWRSVARRAVLAEDTVKHLLYGRNGKPVTRIRSNTERKLLAVQAGRRRMPHAPDLLTTEATP